MKPRANRLFRNRFKDFALTCDLSICDLNSSQNRTHSYPLLSSVLSAVVFVYCRFTLGRYGAVHHYMRPRRFTPHCRETLGGDFACDWLVKWSPTRPPARRVREL